MPTDRQGTTSPVAGKGYGTQTAGSTDLGSSDPTALQGAFSASPVYAGDVPLWDEYLSSVMRGTADSYNDGASNPYFHNVDGNIGGDGEVSTPSMTFSENNPPTYASVSDNNDGAGGTPATAWTPNVASPTGESTNYADLPASPYRPVAADANVGYGVGDGGTLDPLASSTVQGTADPTSTGMSSYTLGEWLSV
tara:strand:+ start:941 stop:1522 length:582 start_codon:yes stop_codon:yes gene_type:complete